MIDDEALIRAAQAGDANAFEQLLERHYDTVYRFAYKWCGRRADAQDITQLACLKLAKSLVQYRFEAAFTSWLYRLVINCARDWARSERRHQSNADADPDGTPDTPTAAEGRVDQQAFYQQLLEQLNELPDGIKETLLLVHAEGLSHAEAATVLGIKESTVSWRLHEFRKHHRTALEGEP